jgi:glycosyltransferase involved in cell wall biosynthesis
LPVESPHPVTRVRFVRWMQIVTSRIGAVHFIDYAAIPVLFFYGVWRILRFRPSCIFTIYFNDIWIATAYLLSKATGLPLILYVHDPFLEPAEYAGGIRALFARWLEPRAIRRCYLIALTESLGEHYQSRYGVPVVTLPNLARGDFFASAPHQTKEDCDGKLTIGFAGCIYDNNLALLQKLASVVRKDESLTLTLFTPLEQKTLEAFKLTGPRISYTFVKDANALIESLAACDLLYLPLCFTNTPSLPRESLQYVLPTKTVDYLLAGCPVLVHCPADFETARFFGTTGAGYVLSSDDEGDLHRCLIDLKSGAGLSISPEGRQRALAYFAPEANRAKFLKYLRAATSAVEQRTPAS